MNIDWPALGMVAAVSIGTSVVFIVLLAGGIRFVSAARLRANQGGSGTASLSVGYALIGLAAILVLVGLWRIIPQFH